MDAITVAIRKAAIRAWLYDQDLHDLAEKAYAKTQPYAKREGKRLGWWQGYYEGLTTAFALHAEVMYPGNNKFNELRVEEEYKKRYG